MNHYVLALIQAVFCAAVYYGIQWLAKQTIDTSNKPKNKREM